MIKVDSTKQTYGSQVPNSIYFLHIVYSSCARFLRLYQGVHFLPSVAVITVLAPLKGPTPTDVSAAMVKM